MAQWVKDLVLSLQGHRLSSWPGNLRMLRVEMHVRRHELSCVAQIPLPSRALCSVC